LKIIKNVEENKKTLKNAFFKQKIKYVKYVFNIYGFYCYVEADFSRFSRFQPILPYPFAIINNQS